MTPEQLAEIEGHDYRPDRNGAAAYRQSDLAAKDVPALLALVREQQARIDSADQAFIDMAQANGGLARSAEKLTQVCRIMSALRGHETPHRVAYNRVWAEVKRLKAEKDAALAYVRRLMAERDTVARAVRSPDLTDAEKLAEIREAFAVVEGEREEADR